MIRHAKTIHKVFLGARALLPLPFFTFRGLAIIFSISTAFAGGISSGEVITLANESRAIAGLSILTENKDLSLAATEKANDMISNDYFAHTSPTGVDPWYWFKNAGYDYKYAGENLAVNYTNAKDQDTAWMNSTTHRTNILNPRYQDIGVAVVAGKIDGKETLVTVELFGSPLIAVADQVAPSSAPSSGESVLADAGIPLVKGIETSVLMPENQGSWAEKVITGLRMRISFVEFATLVSMFFLLFTIFAAPFLLVMKAYEMLEAIFQAKKAENVVATA